MCTDRRPASCAGIGSTRSAASTFGEATIVTPAFVLLSVVGGASPAAAPWTWRRRAIRCPAWSRIPWRFGASASPDVLGSGWYGVDDHRTVGWLHHADLVEVPGVVRSDKHREALSKSSSRIGLLNARRLSSSLIPCLRARPAISGSAAASLPARASGDSLYLLGVAGAGAASLTLAPGSANGPRPAPGPHHRGDTEPHTCVERRVLLVDIAAQNVSEQRRER
jgi:hypothetical protein